jgi:[ribosomal protein S18]-alanine N-acetyltransferase
VILRPGTPTDAPAVAALEVELFGPDAWSATSVLEELEGPGRHALLAVEDAGAAAGPVVGYAVTRQAADVVDLQRIAVHPIRRRAGLATLLLAEASATARERGADRMLLEVSAANTAALGFYAGAGFVEIDRRRGYYRDGTDAVVMERSLSSRDPGRRGSRT